MSNAPDPVPPPTATVIDRDPVPKPGATALDRDPVPKPSGKPSE